MFDKNGRQEVEWLIEEANKPFKEEKSRIRRSQFAEDPEETRELDSTVEGIGNIHEQMAAGNFEFAINEALKLENYWTSKLTALEWKIISEVPEEKRNSCEDIDKFVTYLDRMCEARKLRCIVESYNRMLTAPLVEKNDD